MPAHLCLHLLVCLMRSKEAIAKMGHSRIQAGGSGVSLRIKYSKRPWSTIQVQLDTTPCHVRP
jgi:hypothetical protein